MFRLHPCIPISGTVLSLRQGAGGRGKGEGLGEWLQSVNLPTLSCLSRFLGEGASEAGVLSPNPSGNLALHLDLTAGHKGGEARVHRQLGTTQSQRRENNSGVCPADDGSGVSSLHIRKSRGVNPSSGIL